MVKNNDVLPMDRKTISSKLDLKSVGTLRIGSPTNHSTTLNRDKETPAGIKDTPATLEEK